MPDAAELSGPAERSPGAPSEPAKPPGRARGRKRIAPWVRYVVGIGLGAAALWAVSGQRGELVGATSELSRLNVGFVVAAVASEATSFLSFALMQQRLLRAAGVRLRTGRALSLTVAASAISSSIPAGPAVATVYAYRQYRRAGADEPIAAWALLANLLCSALGLTLVAGAGVLLAEREGAALDLIGVIVSALVIALLAMAVFSQRKFVAKAAVLGIRLSKRLTGFPRGDAEAHLTRVAQQLSQVKLSLRDLVPVLGWSLGNWIFDCGALALGYAAIGAGIPWRGLLLAYGAAQLASNLPITPGGLGVVEGSLTVALVAYGGVQVSTVAAVILYRIISFWGFLPVGWLVWAVKTIRDRRADRARDRAVARPVPDGLAVAHAVADVKGST